MAKLLKKGGAAMSESRHASLGISDEKVLEMYRWMLLARRVDERMWLLNRAGKIPFVISCQGQEAAGWPQWHWIEISIIFCLTTVT